MSQVAGKAFPVRELFLDQVAGYLDVSSCERPRKREVEMTHFNTEFDSPELSKQLLADAAAKCGGAGAAFLLGPHCENEELSPSAIAAGSTEFYTLNYRVFSFL